MLEIERKFLVISDDWRREAKSSTSIRQGYLTDSTEVSVRVRIRDNDASLSIKGPPQGIARPEFEYGIPLGDAESLMELCGGLKVEKNRHLIRSASLCWEIDEFKGANQGLIVAEIELEDEDQEFPRPSWLGPEVTHEPRYLNVRLARRPFTRWQSDR